MQDLESRLSIIRDRFVTTLESKVKDNFALLPRLADNSPEAPAIIGGIYKRFHELYAIAPTVGFPLTGKAAHAAEVILLPAQAGKRGLNTVELVSLKRALEALWLAAQSELESMYRRGV